MQRIMPSTGKIRSLELRLFSSKTRIYKKGMRATACKNSVKISAAKVERQLTKSKCNDIPKMWSVMMLALLSYLHLVTMLFNGRK